MNLIIFTTGMMWKKAISQKSQYWLLALLIITLVIVTPQKRILTQLITLTILTPSIFLVPNWNSSTMERGILALISRSDGYRKVKITQWLFPAVIALILPAIFIWATGIPPWQFWLTLLFVSFAFSISFSLTETFYKYQGRLFFSILWLAQTTGIVESNKIIKFLLFTNYPENTLSNQQYENFLHPDSFVLASLIVLLLTASTYFYLIKSKPESFSR